MLLLLTILVPLAFAIAVAVGPGSWSRQVALLGTLITAVIGFAAFATFDWGNGAAMQLALKIPWIDKTDGQTTLGLSFSLGADTVSMLLIGLTILLGPICVQASKTAITERVRTYYAWLLVLQAAMTGVFCARDLVLFYTCFEFTLIPMYILIALYGSTNRRAAAIKFFLYTFTGSIIALAGLVYVVYFNATHMPTVLAAESGMWTLDIGALEHAARRMPATTQAWVLGALLLGFAVKVPLFPFHTWLPLAHTEAPTAGSVILAGVLLKLGTYGIYRFAMPFAPAAWVEYAPLIATVSIVGILYGGLICWVQTDVKKLVAYSSVAHLGFCILGLTAINSTGIAGSVLYMINHGLSTGALFLLVGMIYERYHTRSMKEIGGLGAKMPVWATFMVFFTLASVGLPGLNGFISEFLCLMGAFQASEAWGQGLWGTAGVAVPGAVMEGTGARGSLGPWYAAVAGLGMIVAAIYLLYMVGKIVFGPLVEPAGHSHGDHSHGTPSAENLPATEADHPVTLPTDLTSREIGVLIPLAALCLFLGIYPAPVLDSLREPVNRTVAAVWDHGGRPSGAGGVRTYEAGPRTDASTDDPPPAESSGAEGAQ